MRVCGPGCQCVNCINKQCTHSDIDDDVNQLEDEGQMESWEEDEYIEESDEDMVVHLTHGSLGLGVLFNCHAKEMYCETYD